MAAISDLHCADASSSQTLTSLDPDECHGKASGHVRRLHESVKPLCVLCRIPPPVGPGNRYLFTTNSMNCTGGCLRCGAMSDFVIGYHDACLSILETWSVDLGISLNDVRDIGICMRTMSEPRCHDISSASISEGLLSPYTEAMLESRFRQTLLKRLPQEIFHQVEAACSFCPNLIVLGETQRLIAHLRQEGGPQNTAMKVDLSLTVYLKPIYINGLSHISRISNQTLARWRSDIFCVQIYCDSSDCS